MTIRILKWISSKADLYVFRRRICFCWNHDMTFEIGVTGFWTEGLIKTAKVGESLFAVFVRNTILKSGNRTESRKLDKTILVRFETCCCNKLLQVAVQVRGLTGKILSQKHKSLLLSENSGKQTIKTNRKKQRKYFRSKRSSWILGRRVVETLF